MRAFVNILLPGIGNRVVFLRIAGLPYLAPAPIVGQIGYPRENPDLQTPAGRFSPESGSRSLRV